jgi:hypothetical protein
VNDKLESIWEEAIVALCKVLSWHSLGGTEENHEKFKIVGFGPRLYLGTSRKQSRSEAVQWK